MSLHRTLKQAYYAAGFILLVIVVAFGLFRLIVPATPDTSISTATPVPEFSSLTIQSVQYSQSDRIVDAVVQIKNPNVRAGLSNFTITFSFYDSANQFITDASTAAYILPGSTQYFAVYNVSVPVPVASVTVALPDNPTFTTIADTYQLPRFSTIMRDLSTKQIGNQTYEEQKGLISNNNPFVFRTVDIIVLALNNDDEIISVGQTTVGDLEISEQREFTVQWLQSGQEIDRVIAIPTTNIFLSDNIREIEDDPSLL